LINNLAWHIAMSGSGFAEAESLARMAVQRDPGSTAYADTLGMVCLKAGKSDDAYHVFQGLIRREPANPVFHLHLAQSMIAKGERQKARAELETALKFRPQGSDADQIHKLLSGLS
jgi:predicted Zn-dependent protease